MRLWTAAAAAVLSAVVQFSSASECNDAVEATVKMLGLSAEAATRHAATMAELCESDSEDQLSAVLAGTMRHIVGNPHAWLDHERANALETSVPFLATPAVGMASLAGLPHLSTDSLYLLPALLPKAATRNILAAVGFSDEHVDMVAGLAEVLEDVPAGARVRALGSALLALRIWRPRETLWQREPHARRANDWNAVGAAVEWKARVAMKKSAAQVYSSSEGESDRAMSDRSAKSIKSSSKGAIKDRQEDTKRLQLARKRSQKELNWQAKNEGRQRSVQSLKHALALAEAETRLSSLRIETDKPVSSGAALATRQDGPLMDVASADVPVFLTALGAWRDWGATWTAVPFDALWLHTWASRVVYALATLDATPYVWERRALATADACATRKHRVGEVDIAERLATLRDVLWGAFSGIPLSVLATEKRAIEDSRLDRVARTADACTAGGAAPMNGHLPLLKVIDHGTFCELLLALRILHPGGAVPPVFRAHARMAVDYVKRGPTKNTDAKTAALPHRAALRANEEELFGHQARRVAARLGAPPIIVYFALRHAYGGIWRMERIGNTHCRTGEVPAWAALRVLRLDDAYSHPSDVLVQTVVHATSRKGCLSFPTLVALVFAHDAVAKPLSYSENVRSCGFSAPGAADNIRAAAALYGGANLPGLTAVAFAAAQAAMAGTSVFDLRATAEAQRERLGLPDESLPDVLFGAALAKWIEDTNSDISDAGVLRELGSVARPGVEAVIAALLATRDVRFAAARSSAMETTERTRNEQTDTLQRSESVYYIERPAVPDTLSEASSIEHAFGNTADQVNMDGSSDSDYGEMHDKSVDLFHIGPVEKQSSVRFALPKSGNSAESINDSIEIQSDTEVTSTFQPFSPPKLSRGGPALYASLDKKPTVDSDDDEHDSRDNERGLSKAKSAGPQRIDDNRRSATAPLEDEELDDTYRADREVEVSSPPSNLSRSMSRRLQRQASRRVDLKDMTVGTFQLYQSHATDLLAGFAQNSLTAANWFDTMSLISTRRDAGNWPTFRLSFLNQLLPPDARFTETRATEVLRVLRFRPAEIEAIVGAAFASSSVVLRRTLMNALDEHLGQYTIAPEPPVRTMLQRAYDSLTSCFSSASVE